MMKMKNNIRPNLALNDPDAQQKLQALNMIGSQSPAVQPPAQQPINLNPPTMIPMQQAEAKLKNQADIDDANEAKMKTPSLRFHQLRNKIKPLNKMENKK